MTPWVLRLIIANAVMYLASNVYPFLFSLLEFVPAWALVRPWTIVTYMFLHGSLSHIGFNMLALYFFGTRVEMRIGSRRFIELYVVSGIGGALLSLVFASYGSPYVPIVGASGAVFGVSLAFAYFWPHALIYIWGVIPVPARLMVIINTLLTLWSIGGGVGGGIAHFAHLGGYAGAYLYLKWLDRSRGAFKRRATAAPRDADDRVARWRSIDRTRVHEANRAELDRILDKIGAQGVGSLTPQERTFLSNFVPPDDRVPPVS
jgi:membrane associated rhomboid family serine protease